MYHCRQAIISDQITTRAVCYGLVLFVFAAKILQGGLVNNLTVITYLFLGREFKMYVMLSHLG